MDVQTALICVGVFVVSAVVVYLISVLGIREKTFEEAIEEQKRRSQEEIVQLKSEKSKKENNKKYKKWSRQKKEKSGEKYQEIEEIAIEKQSPHEHVDFKSEPEIISESDSESKPPKIKKRKVNTLSKTIPLKKEETQIDNTSELLISHDKKEQELKTAKKEITESTVHKSEQELIKINSSIQEGTKIIEKEVKSVETDINVKDITLSVNLLSAAVNSNVPKKKKSKQEHMDSGDVSVITGSKLLNLVKDAILTDEDIQVMIDFLLNKQGDASGWTKKNDPMAALKKQLQEKEQVLEVEQKQAQATTTKLKELRKELNQEKSKLVAMEQASRDKINQLQQEFQAIQARMKSSHEQHLSEMSVTQSKLQQLQSDLTESTDIVKKLEEEKIIIEDEISVLEIENEKNVNEIAKLQTELKNIQKLREENEKERSTAQQTKDSLQQQNKELEACLQELTSSNSKETNSLKLQLNDSNCKLKSIEQSFAAISQELKEKKTNCLDFEKDNNNLRQRLQTVENIIKEREQELKKLQANLEQTCMQRNELESRLKELENKLEEMTRNHEEQSRRLVTIKIEKENLNQFPIVGERTSAEGEEAPHNHQNGDVHSETDKITQKKMLEFSEHEKIVEEKEKAFERLCDEVNEQKSTISILSEELEVQKSKNNELREKNWKAMEALSSAESNIKQLRKESEEKLLKCQKEAESKVKQIQKSSIQNGKAEDRFIQELKEQKEKAEERLRQAEDSWQEQIKNKEEKFSQMQNELQQRLQTIQELDSKTKELSQKNNEHIVQIQTEQKKEQELLQRIFPDIKVDQKLEHSVWISHFEREASNTLSVIKSNVIEHTKADSFTMEIDELKNKLSSVMEEKDRLDTQIQHYKTVLSETESILNKLQNSVEAEEIVWRERLQSKEQELEKIAKKNEELILQKKTLEENLLQLQGMEEATTEMQAKLKELQAKLQGEETEKKVLEQKFDEAKKSALNIQEQLESRLKEIEEVKKENDVLNNEIKNLQDIKVQLEKERKITRDLSAQTIKLNSLVKIGQDALKAEQETAKELQAQLLTFKNSNLNGPPDIPEESAGNVQSEDVSGKK